MKASLACYILLLLLEGLITFHATSSPMLMAVPIAGLLMYAALSLRSGAMAEGAAIFFSALSLGLSLMQFQGNLSAIFIGLLSVTHFFAATQATWEILHGGKDKDRAPPQLRLTVFSIAFYAAFGVAWLVMSGEDLKLMPLHRQLLAGIIVLLALGGWELSRIVRLRRAESRSRLNPAELLRRLLAGGGIALALLLVFVALLPLVADFLAKFSPHLSLPSFEAPKDRPARRQGEKGPSPDTPLTGAKQNTTGGPDQTAAGGESPLPRRARLQLPKTPRIHLQFERRADAERLTAAGPLYVRSLALGRYEGDTWKAVSEDGFWSLDEQDGRKDGRVTLADPGPSTVPHTIFLAATDGGALPALAGVVQFGMTKIYTMPDDWYQAQITGDIRYTARSAPKFFDQLPPDERRAAVLAGYTTLPEGKLRDQLVEQSRGIFSSRRSLSDLVAALRGHFAENFSYSEIVQNPKDLPPLENFLLDEKKGYCDFFSTAAALLLRRADVPTRVAFGYMGGQFDAKTGTHTFLGSHAHSWTEIFVEKHGWVICDFTPPNPNAPTGENGATQPPGGLNLDGFESVVEEEKKAAEAEKKAEEAESALLGQIQNLVPKYAPILAAVMLAGSVVVVLVWAFLRHRKESKSPEAKAKRAAALREKQPPFFVEFVTMCEEFGYAKEPGETLLELQAVLKEDKFYTNKFDALARYYYQTRYEDAPADAAAEESWISLIRDFKRERRAEMKSKQ